MVDDRVLEKWEKLINACKAYYIDSLPTGLLDSEFDELEIRAAKEDGFFVRDYVFQTYAKGVRVTNSYIETTSDRPNISNLVLLVLEGSTDPITCEV